MNVMFFLGANSGSGFYSLYDDFARTDKDFLYLIKGGPGCGKSSFMRKIGSKAEELGYDVEYIICSGDPDSLDGIYIPTLNIGLADATAPHIIEPELFGLNSCYVNLGEFCSRTDSEKIAQYSKQYKQMYTLAYAYLHAAASIKIVQIPQLISENELKTAKKRAQSALRRELGELRCTIKQGNSQRRFIRGISCKGEISLTDSVKILCKRIYSIDDRFGLAQIYLSEVAESACSRGENAILCPSPLCPDELDAVILPEYSLGFVSASAVPVKNPWRHIRLDALIPADRIKAHKAEIKQQERLYKELTDGAIGYLAKAKEYHDLLEAEYKPLVDFDALNEFTEGFINKLFQ